MLKSYSPILVAIAAASLLIANSSAQTISYDASVQSGNQNYPGNLGLDFDVNQSIVITSLGAFDSNADGFTGTVSVAIFNRNTGLQVGPSAAFTGLNGTLVNGDRFLAVTPFVLPPGNYSVVAVGYSNSDLNGNSTTGGLFVPSTESSGGGAISFVGSGRYDGNTTLDFPSIVPPGTPENVFLAGTFRFAAISPLMLTKSFSTQFVPVGGAATLTLAIANGNTSAVTGIGLTDAFPTGLVIATPNALTNSCGGTVTATAGSGGLTLANGGIGASAACTITVAVLATAPGQLTNTTSTVTAAGLPAGAAATAAITVIPADAFQVRYASNLAVGDSLINVTNTGASSTNSFPVQNGNLCVNAYVFSPDEQLISCCSCTVTPNGLASLSARGDLISNTLTPGVPTSVVVKLLASSQPTCNPASVTVASLAGGLDAWGTTIHPAPVTPGTPPGTFGITETPFTRATLSAAELNRITSLCGFIQINGSGYGLCKSCRLGGLGAAHQ